MPSRTFSDHVGISEPRQIEARFATQMLLQDGEPLPQRRTDRMHDEEKSKESSRDPESGRRHSSRQSSSANIFRRLKHEMSGQSVDEDERQTAEIRPIPKHYFFQRPRALQYAYKGGRIAHGDDADPITHQISHDSDVRYTAEGVAISRERIDLFIDLVWVGVLTNISEVFSEGYFVEDESSTHAFLTFILIFMAAFRIWNMLREFLNSFYMDDTVQRMFVFWILLLSVFYGNQLYYINDEFDTIKNGLITVYLIIRFSFTTAQLVYSIWIPWMRKLLFAGFLLALPSIGLWIGGIFLDQPACVGPIVAALFWEYLNPLLLETEIGRRLTDGDYHKEVDPIHLRSRMGSFLIITIGEGVLLLIKGGVLGHGFSSVTSIAIWALMLYFTLAYLYFARDMSVLYIPAVRRHGYRVIIWIFFHVPTFASFISLSAGIMWFVDRDSPVPAKSKEVDTSELSEEEIDHLSTRALWVIGISLAIIIFSYTMIALLDRPLDPPKALLVPNRYARLAGRPIYIIVVLTVLIYEDIDVYLYLGICAVGLTLLMLYETIASLERPARMFEPKGLTVLMKREYRPAERGSIDAVGREDVRIPI